MNPSQIFHLCGAFTATELLLRTRLRRWPIIVFVCICCIMLEVYQWHNEPMYTGKVLDTVLDIIADGFGITAAAYRR